MVYHYCEVVKGPGQNTRHMGREIVEKLRNNVLKILNIMPSPLTNSFHHVTIWYTIYYLNTVFGIPSMNTAPSLKNDGEIAGARRSYL
jgi:hypothetical protein